jgi:hypothetical protein
MYTFSRFTAQQGITARSISYRIATCISHVIISTLYCKKTRNWKDIQGYYAVVERLFTNSFRRGMNSDRLSNITDR